MALTLIRLGFLEVFFLEWESQFDSIFIFQVELIQYKQNLIKLLSNLFKIG